MKARTFTPVIAIVVAVLSVALSSASPAHATSAAVRGTPVTRIVALVNLNIRTGPSLHHRVVGRLWRGEHATVTAASDNYNWWRIRCPWGGTCWVSANPNYSRPVAWRR